VNAVGICWHCDRCMQLVCCWRSGRWRRCPYALWFHRFPPSAQGREAPSSLLALPFRPVKSASLSSCHSMAKSEALEGKTGTGGSSRSLRLQNHLYLSVVYISVLFLSVQFSFPLKQILPLWRGRGGCLHLPITRMADQPPSTAIPTIPKTS